MFEGQRATLIIEAIARAAAPGAFGVAPLGHKAADDAMEGGVVVKAITCQENEVIDSDGGLSGEEFDLDVALLSMHDRRVVLRGVNLHRRGGTILFCHKHSPLKKIGDRCTVSS